MAETSAIEWTDATVNFWWGCTKVSPGCDHCYAEKLNNFRGNKQWGVGAERRKIKGAASLIRRLDNGYAEWSADYHVITGNARAFGQPIPTIYPRRRVFIQSMSDLFDLEVPIEWFGEAWGHIESCRRLDIQIVTKRLSAVQKRLAAIGRTEWPKHAGLIITVVNQIEADRDIPRLLALKAELGIPWVGLSIEPMLGPIDIRKWLDPWTCADCEFHGSEDDCGPDGCEKCGESDAFQDADECKHCGACDQSAKPSCPKCGSHRSFGRDYGFKFDIEKRLIDWIICGGESGRRARPMHPDWPRALRDQCAAAGVPFMFKQWGQWLPAGQETSATMPTMTKEKQIEHETAGRFSFARVRPDAHISTDVPVWRIGKHAAGRLLDGVEHNGVPT